MIEREIETKFLMDKAAFERLLSVAWELCPDAPEVIEHHERESRRGKYILGSGPHGRGNSAYAPVLRAVDAGQAPERERNPRQQGRLHRWKNEFYAHMSAHFPLLERGEPAIETQRQHRTTQEFKREQQSPEYMQLYRKYERLRRRWEKVSYSEQKRIVEQERQVKMRQHER